MAKKKLERKVEELVHTVGEPTHIVKAKQIGDKNFTKNFRHYVRGLDCCLGYDGNLAINATGKDGEYLIGIPENMVQKLGPEQLVRRYIGAYEKAKGYRQASFTYWGFRKP